MNYTCLPDAGPNPDFGYTNFDHMGWSLVMSFQLLTMDFWENIYDKVNTIVVDMVVWVHGVFRVEIIEQKLNNLAGCQPFCKEPEKKA